MFVYTEVMTIGSDQDIRLDRITNTAEGDCKHTHDFIELAYIEKGNMIHIIDNKPYVLPQGSLLVCFPGQTHSYIALNDSGATLDNFYIKKLIGNDVLRNILEAHNLSFSSQNIYQTAITSPFFQPIILFNEFIQKQKHIDIIEMMLAYAYKSENYIQIINEGISGILASFFYDNENLAEIPENISKNILELIEADIMSEDLSLQKISNKLNYDAGYLTRSFKSYCGITITDYIQMKRMNMTKHLLCETDMPIDEIAPFVGYENRNFFYKLFKDLYTQTPSEFRRLNKLIHKQKN